ncbi:unnamed protein product [marine sediment metagenome]|uniref:Uncharacterized protein n=1 Tax=marine sediment metagenome TaxID=412755 RepID=X1BGW5_9ZZZZ
MGLEKEYPGHPDLTGGGETELHSHPGDGGIAKGTSFPESPEDGDVFYRTDLDHLYVYVAEA